MNRRPKPVVKFFSLILALLVFNMSVDPPDLLINLDSDASLEEDLRINEMESVAEIILEKALHQENAVPETDDPDSDNTFKKEPIPHALGLYKFFHNTVSALTIRHNPSWVVPFSFDPYLDFFSPPPEA